MNSTEKRLLIEEIKEIMVSEPLFSTDERPERIFRLVESLWTDHSFYPSKENEILDEVLGELEDAASSLDSVASDVEWQISRIRSKINKR